MEEIKIIQPEDIMHLLNIDPDSPILAEVSAPCNCQCAGASGYRELA